MNTLRLVRALGAAALVISTLALPATAQTSAQAAAVPAMPDLNPAEWFDGKMGGTFGAKTVTAFAKSKKVAIAGFRVVFVTHNEAHAFTRATYLPGGIETGSARAKMIVDLQGVDDATMQSITDKAYQQFVAQLKATGREVIIPEQSAFSGFNLAGNPPQEASLGKMKGKAFSPAGLPVWWQIGDSWGDAKINQKNMRAFNELSKAHGAAITIAPMIVVDFAHMSSSGANKSGFTRRGADVGATLAMSVPTFTTRVVRAEETRYGGLVFKGDDGMLNMTRRLDTDIEFAEMHKGKRSERGTLVNLFGADSKSSKSTNIAETTNEQYAAAANEVLSKTVGAFAKLIASHPAM